MSGTDDSSDGGTGLGQDCLRHLGWAGMQAAFQSRLVSPIARDSRLTLSEDLDSARRALAEVDGFEWLVRADTEAAGTDETHASRLSARLRELEDLRESMEVARGGGQLSVPELFGVHELLSAVSAANALLRVGEPEQERHRASVATLREGLGELEPLPDLLATLARAIERDATTGEPVLADAASPELKAARKQLKDRRRELVRRAESLLRRSDYTEALQDAFWTEREGRVVLPFRSGGLGSVRNGIIHASSGSGQTTYVEPPELVEDNNAVRGAQLRVSAEERRIMVELSRHAGEHAAVVVANQAALEHLDRVRARLLLGDAYGGQTPRLEPGEREGELSLPEARHPLMMLDGVEVVPNDLAVTRGRALVVTGPNAGGKTVALKTIGLCVLMARAGLRLPTVRPAKVPLFRHIVTDVGDDQSIHANLSTFSAHLGHLREAVSWAEQDGAATLVLLDEIAVGTDPEQGAALGEAILVHLVRHGATVVVTTHYERLKLLATRDDVGDRFENASVGFDVENMRPTFEIRLGMPGSSSALVVARRLGLSEEVLGEAERLLGDEGLKVDVLLREIESERERLATAREKLEKEERRLAHNRREVERREKKALDGARSRKHKAFEAAASELRELESELKDRRKQLRKHGAESLPERSEYVGDSRERVEQHRENERPAGGEAPTELIVGQRVLVPSMDSEGEVLAIKGDRITVQLPQLKTTLKRHQVRAAAPPKKTARKRGVAEPIYSFDSDAGKHFGADAKPVDPGPDDVLDLRGTRFEDAAEEVERGLSSAIERDRDVLVIKHGHGSGELRRAVRQHLERLDYVKRHRAGLSREGGDAVTVVWMEA